jgi:hypothetical protein
MSNSLFENSSGVGQAQKPPLGHLGLFKFSLNNSINQTQLRKVNHP